MARQVPPQHGQLVMARADIVAGKVDVYQYVNDEHPTTIDTVSDGGGLTGGTGYIVRPIISGAPIALTAIRTGAFMPRHDVVGLSLVWVQLVWTYRTEVRKSETKGGKFPTLTLTD